MTFGWKGKYRSNRYKSSGSHYISTKTENSKTENETLMESSDNTSSSRFDRAAQINRLDEQMGFPIMHSEMVSSIDYGDNSNIKRGWLFNMQSTIIADSSWASGRSAVSFYFLDEDGECFKFNMQYSPYFYISCTDNHATEDLLKRKYGNTIEKIQVQEKEDLDMPNHLMGYKRTFLKLTFRNTIDLLAVRKHILSALAKKGSRSSSLSISDCSTSYEKEELVHIYQKSFKEIDNYQTQLTTHAFRIHYDDSTSKTYTTHHNNLDDLLLDIREYDIPYHLRVCIDHDIRIGMWYQVTILSSLSEDGEYDLSHPCPIVKMDQQPIRPDPIVFAFDIEATKQPLKFPDAEFDSVMMISYMVDGKGYLIVNRQVVSQDIDDFEYSPKPEYEGHFHIFNEPDEKSVLIRFFSHIQTIRPRVFVTYNGDGFDWPFIDTRSKHHGLSMRELIGVYCHSGDDEKEYQTSYAIHMDAFKWVKRDSYLPAGSHGLKAVTAIKLSYSPLEVDPEDMLRLARQDPQTLASYSVSDALCTYYLYMKYVHPFIFSLCNIIPLSPDEVLRKGSGTLCETLLMAEAYKANVIMPNKHTTKPGSSFDGHLLESETYIGGHVECIESGVFRSDIPVDFSINEETIQTLLVNLDDMLQFTLSSEHHVSKQDIVNYDQVKNQIEKCLMDISNQSKLHVNPLIYHLDVAAMYPNIILTNRLQPPAIVNESTCAVCDLNRPGKQCQRKMTWTWKGDYFPAKRNEVKLIYNQLSSETIQRTDGSGPISFNTASGKEQESHLKKRLTDYCKKIYKRIHETQTIQREAIVCMQENSFYIDTVRKFRDRRYDFKHFLKDTKRSLENAIENSDIKRIEECKKLHVLYDSLQLAHKCILNSFYGYVMRKGSRWYSMEMAGVVCETGASIIRLARQWIEKLGRPLELDTDGIWCMLPSCFPDKFTFQTKSGSNIQVSYPCTILNKLVHEQFTNHQYHTKTGPNPEKDFIIHKENSIFFEIDGPYRAMIIPASTEEDRLLKKRYAVFHQDGTLAELKGFEVKRRGELKLIKIFQSCIFDSFLLGNNLSQSYENASSVAKRWLNMLHNKGIGMHDTELFELLSENRNMSKSLEDYGDMKSTSISTAKRLAEFLGDAMIKDKGLSCKFIIASQPNGAPVAQRAIPTAIFQADPQVRDYHLRKWLRSTASKGDYSAGGSSLKSILDWKYYLERFESVVQKLIVIPAAMQGLSNPLPIVKYPDWLQKRDMQFNLSKQSTLSFKKKDLIEQSTIELKDESITPINVIFKHATLLSNDYKDWISQQKPKWRAMLERKKRKRRFGNLISAFSGPQSSHHGTIWNIVKIKESSPGNFVVWYHSPTTMMLSSFHLTVSRVFYVLFRFIPPQNILGPYARPVIQSSSENRLWSLSISNDNSIIHNHAFNNINLHQNLYQFDMPESVYQSSHFKINTWQSLLPYIERTFETNVPLLFKTIAHIGVVSQEFQGTIHKEELDLIDIQPKPELKMTAFKSIEKENLMVIYDWRSTGNDHSIYMDFFLVLLPCYKRAALWIRQSTTKDVIEKNQEQLLKLLNEGSDDKSFQSIQIFAIKSTSHGNVQSLEKSLCSWMSKFITYDCNSYPLTVSFTNRPKLSVMDILFPWPVIQSNISISNYEDSQSSFTTLGHDWEKRIIETLVKSHYHSSGLMAWWKEQIEYSQVTNLPLCHRNDKVNGSRSKSTFAMDVMFARCIHECNGLWWFNESLYTKNIASSNIPWKGINEPGWYDQGCNISIQVSGLFINAILGDLDHQNNNEDIPMEHNIPTRELLRLLRVFIGRIGKELAQTHSITLDMLLVYLERWILVSGESVFYHHELNKLVLQNVETTLRLLEKEFIRLGIKIVHASPNGKKWVLATRKPNIETTHVYMEHISKTLSNIQELQWISWNINSSQYSHQTFSSYLLWLNPSNQAMNISSSSNWIQQWKLLDFLDPDAILGFQNIVSDLLDWATNKELGKDISMMPLFSWMSTLINWYKHNNIQESNAFLSCAIDRICAILSLIPRVDIHVPAFRKQCYILTCEDGTGAFNDDAAKRNLMDPSFGTLLYFPCYNADCLSVIEVDAESSRIFENYGKSGSSITCSHCMTMLPYTVIEEHIFTKCIELLHNYYTQDISCTKCHMIKEYTLCRDCTNCQSCDTFQLASISSKNFQDELQKYQSHSNILLQAFSKLAGII